ncbi:hypothetical protein [Alienimonas chondri]|uniref:hypothetical protein n=1 Tax=Alienimonas chondri TaxID=2681879 RepID=UPI00148904E5|nr:hypothetical protein [Alienimonas chondri]
MKSSSLSVLNPWLGIGAGLMVTASASTLITLVEDRLPFPIQPATHMDYATISLALLGLCLSSLVAAGLRCQGVWRRCGSLGETLCLFVGTSLGGLSGIALDLIERMT